MMRLSRRTEELEIVADNVKISNTSIEFLRQLWVGSASDLQRYDDR